MTSDSVQIIIPTLNAASTVDNFEDNFKKIIGCGYDVLVIDSSSSDETANIVKRQGAELITIPQEEFNHGATREFVRKKSKHQMLVFMTQDVEIISTDFIRLLIKPLIQDHQVAVSYARQIPFDDADIFEAFPRIFNYPEKSQVRSLEDVKKYGVYTFFCSNSCAAYRNEALDEIGGFDTLMNSEEYFAVVKLLDIGYKIAYVAESLVKHSHSYTLREGFKRYFDIGCVRAKFPEIRKLVGSPESRGGVFFKQLVIMLVKQRKIHLIPYAFLQTAIQLLGFLSGYYGAYLTINFKKK